MWLSIFFSLQASNHWYCLFPPSAFLLLFFFWLDLVSSPFKLNVHGGEQIFMPMFPFSCRIHVPRESHFSSSFYCTLLNPGVTAEHKTHPPKLSHKKCSDQSMPDCSKAGSEASQSEKVWAAYSTFSIDPLLLLLQGCPLLLLLLLPQRLPDPPSASMTLRRRERRGGEDRPKSLTGRVPFRCWTALPPQVK